MDVRFFQDTPGDAGTWDQYVARQDGATVDHLWGWRRVLSESFGFTPHYLGAVEDGQLVGILPMFRMPRGFGRAALSSIPFGNYGGICADTEEVAAALLEEARELMRRTRAAYVELRHRTAMRGETLQQRSVYSRFWIPLTGDAHEHLRHLGQHNRAKVRKAEKSGLQIKVCRDLAPVYPIHLHTTHRLGTPCFPRRYFELILETFASQAEIHLACLDSQPVAYTLSLIFKETFVCQFNGSLEPFFKYYPNHLLIWHGIERACTLQLREFDYCRSRSTSGSADFKRKMHLIEEPLAYQYELVNGKSLPQRNPSNPKYQWMIRTWQRLPLSLTQWLGPTVVRYFA